MPSSPFIHILSDATIFDCCARLGFSLSLPPSLPTGRKSHFGSSLRPDGSTGGKSAMCHSLCTATRFCLCVPSMGQEETPPRTVVVPTTMRQLSDTSYIDSTTVAVIFQRKTTGGKQKEDEVNVKRTNELDTRKENQQDKTTTQHIQTKRARATFKQPTDQPNSKKK